MSVDTRVEWYPGDGSIYAFAVKSAQVVGDRVRVVIDLPDRAATALRNPPPSNADIRMILDRVQRFLYHANECDRCDQNGRQELSMDVQLAIERIGR